MIITERHRLVAYDLFTRQATDKQIREKFHVKPETLHRWKEDPDFLALVDEVEAALHLRTRAILALLAPAAAGRLSELLKSANDETARKAAVDILDQARADTGATRRKTDEKTPENAPRPELPAGLAADLYRVLTEYAHRPPEKPAPPDPQMSLEFPK